MNSIFLRRPAAVLLGKSRHLRIGVCALSTSQDEMRKVKLILEDGSVHHGYSFGAETPVSGELVFSTGMVGYPEALTDPSFRGQLLSLTYPMVGNYGVPDIHRMDELGLPKGFESDRIHASALLVQDYSHHYSHWDAKESLADWLKRENIPGLTGFDTRMLTRKIRSKGAMLARIEFEGDDTLVPNLGANGFVDSNAKHLVAEVSNPNIRVFGKGNGVKVLAVDCGIKNNIIRMLVQKGAEVTVVPWDYKFSEELDKYDGLFLSNGPGDPTKCTSTIEELRKVLKREGDEVKPIFGICLGNQLLALAAGATSKKLPFGNRGQNQPVINKITGECYITPQNHGFAVDDSQLPDGWKTLFSNINDGSNEGIMHETKPYFTAQFHPEAMGGPTDTSHFFDQFLGYCQNPKSRVHFEPRTNKPIGEKPDVKKVLVLGSGGLSIGQAGEFDYSGAQAIKALKEEGKEVVLINPNIASVQTNIGSNSEFQADQVFFLPVTKDFVEEVIKREKPDSIVVSMGGQTALNVGVELYQDGVFDKYGVQVLGTPIQVVMDTEDRQAFDDKMKEINKPTAKSFTANNMDEAIEAAEKIGYPLMIRSAYALGGLGSGICEDKEKLIDMASKAFSLSPQILVEKSMLGWKEVEYEVVRDAYDNCVTVCNMENFDALGVHTGDSIVIAPSQTLSNEEYHMLRTTAIDVVRHLGVIGECNIQYALNPKSLEYCIIEVNARLSRSSALASKATGYPLAFVAAKLGLGMQMSEVNNAVTKVTQACFEPSLDYCVTKIPRWDLSKFENVSTKIGSAMKSVGEVMSIGRNWEESLQKAMRMVDPSIRGFETRKTDKWSQGTEMEEELLHPSDRRIFAIAQCLREGTHSVEQLHDITSIDNWFLQRLQNIVTGEKKLTKTGKIDSIDVDQMRNLKQLGFSDIQIASIVNSDEDTVRATRKSLGVKPAIKQIDTLAAEYPAQTNYLYATYNGTETDVKDNEKGGIMVLGNGAYRIGSSVEFDWCAVSAIRTVKELGKRGIMVNYNPETVSTDYDECDQLYFEELSRERVMDIYEQEESDGVIVSVGGQIPQNLAMPLHEAGVNILGTSALMIDNAEDRWQFSAMLDRIGVQQPEWMELTSFDSALDFADKAGYPVLVRPSYVLSGAAMNVANNAQELNAFLSLAEDVSADKPVVISKFIKGAKEIEMDAVADNGKVIAAALHEHVENAGVHSGDATLLLPPQEISNYSRNRVEEMTRKIAKELNITGPFNIQFISKGSDVLVIECNLRASRSFPFVSKTTGAEFIEAATKVMLKEDYSKMDLPALGERNRPNGYVGCKAPMFSFTRLRGADPKLGVEMASTGEVACFGADKHEAFLKSLLSTGFKMPKKNILLTFNEALRPDLVHASWQFHELGYNLFATPETHKFLKSCQVPCTLANFPDNASGDGADAVSLLRDKQIDLVISCPENNSVQTQNNYDIRRTAVDFGVPLLTQPQIVNLFSESLARHQKGELTGLQPDSLFDYYKNESESDKWSAPNQFH